MLDGGHHPNENWERELLLRTARAGDYKKGTRVNRVPFFHSKFFIPNSRREIIHFNAASITFATSAANAADPSFV